MISPKKIQIVYFKELKDILRDRRTLYSMILMPILLYPLLSIGMGALVGSQIEKMEATRQPVTILGEEHSPAVARAIRESNKFEIIPADSLRQGMLDLAAQDSTLDRETINRLFTDEVVTVPDSVRGPIFSRAIDERLVRAVVRISPGFDNKIAAGDSVVLDILYDKSDAKSETAGDKLRDWAVEYRDSMVTTTLTDLGLDNSVIKPFWILRSNVASKSRMGGMILGMMLPYMLLILAIVGGMYPALDMTAGEKERNTLETLLAAPLSRFDIAAGKFLTTFTASMVSMMLALTSMTLTAKYGFASMAGGKIAIGLSADSVFWLLFLMVPAATMFSAMMIAVAIAAKSYKEGQSYLTPILMLVILPAMVSFIPGFELTGGWLFVPIVNICLTLKEVAMGTYKVWRILVVFGSTTVYALVALFVAQRIFERESVLFRT
jgi:sodium transport system permease protein